MWKFILGLILLAMPAGSQPLPVFNPATVKVDKAKTVATLRSLHKSGYELKEAPKGFPTVMRWGRGWKSLWVPAGTTCVVERKTTASKVVAGRTFKGKYAVAVMPCVNRLEKKILLWFPGETVKVVVRTVTVTKEVPVLRTITLTEQLPPQVVERVVVKEIHIPTPPPPEKVERVYVTPAPEIALQVGGTRRTESASRAFVGVYGCCKGGETVVQTGKPGTVPVDPDPLPTPPTGTPPNRDPFPDGY
jgi:hypothetical protein